MNDTNSNSTENTTGTPSKKIPYKFKYICKSKCKKFALEFAKDHRAGKFTRVGESFLIRCEAALVEQIRSQVKSHPSKGKTLL